MPVLAIALALIGAPLIAPPHPQEPVEGTAAPTALEVLDGLIERANTLTGFRALYRMTRPGEEESTIELLYVAPHRMRLDMGSVESEHRIRMWSVDQHMCMLGGPPHEQTWANIDYRKIEAAEPAVLTTLQRLFPNESVTLEAGPTVEVTWQLDPRSDKVEFQLSLSWITRGRITPIGWLHTLQREPDLLVVHADALVQEHARYRAAVSRATGFLTELDMVGADGQKAELRLQELDLEPVTDETVFTLPDRPESARDISAQLEESMSAKFSPSVMRRECYEWVGHQLAQGSIEWQESTRAAWGNVMRDLYQPLMQPSAADYLEKHRRYLEGLEEWVAKERARGEPVEVLRELAAQRRDEQSAALERAMASGFDKLVASDSEERRSAHQEDLRAVEHEVHDELYREIYIRPAMDEFDAAVGRALGD